MSNLNSLAKVAAGAQRLEEKLETLAKVSGQMQHAAAQAAEAAARQAAVANSASHGSTLGQRYHATESARARGPPSGKHGGGRRSRKTKRSKRSKRKQTRRR